MRRARAVLFFLAAGFLLGQVRRHKYKAQRILRVSRVVSDLGRAEAFYRDGLGFRTVARGWSDKAALAALNLGDIEAEEVVMRLGCETIALVRFATQGRPYPLDSRSNDLWFQHLAIVVSDMDAAYAHLAETIGWRPISEDGPQLLPPSSGAVRAFKFRDPDGHPLELIWFPPGQGRAVWHEVTPGMLSPEALFQGVDHSALCVASTLRSLQFYRGLDFRVSARTLNHSLAQARLDGLAGTRVRVTGLRPASDTGLRLELLDYQPSGRAAALTFPNDVMTDWVTIAISPPPGDLLQAVRDPDGHLLILVDQGTVTTGLPA